MISARDKILVLVDDSVLERRILADAIVEKTGFTVVALESGDQCLEWLKSHSPDLILMDAIMPGTLGLDALKEIRRTRSALELPVIMVTSKTDSADTVEALRAGANDYIGKPVHFEVAISRIRTHLHLAELSLSARKLSDLAALQAMVATYNHELNNPLAIAITTLERLEAEQGTCDSKQVIARALWRMADVVRRIRDASDQAEVVFEDYPQPSRFLKI